MVSRLVHDVSNDGHSVKEHSRRGEWRVKGQDWQWQLNIATWRCVSVCHDQVIGTVLIELST